MQKNRVPLLFSDRLIFEPMSLKFATYNYVSWLNDTSVNQYLEVGKKNTLQVLEGYLKQTIENDTYFWAIVLKESNKHIGNIKIDPINCKHGYGEYGIMMGDKTEWNKGYAKEASKTIIKFCFETLNLRKINLGVVEANIAALEMYKKLGFEIEGIYKNHCIYDGFLHNIVRMAIFNKN